MIGGTAIARRYARALFGLGQERGDPAALLAEVEEITDTILDNPELRRVLLTPIHPRRERRGVVRELAVSLGLSDEVRASVMLLVDENRTALLPDIREGLKELVEEAAGRVKAQVSSARPLDAGQLEALRQALTRRIGAEVTIESEVDPSLIGGVVARVGGLLLDGSIRSQLDKLSERLRKGAV